MEKIIEKDSPRIPLLVLAAIFFLILGSGIAPAYMGGVFTGKDPHSAAVHHDISWA
jgi:hypothetical protein